MLKLLPEKINKYRQSDASLPLYICIRNAVYDMIISGELPESFRFPSDRILAKQLRTTHITLGKALNELRSQGFLSRSPSTGTFVNALSPDIIDAPGSPNKVVTVIFDNIDNSTFQSELFINLHMRLQKVSLDILTLSSNDDPMQQFEQIRSILLNPNCCSCVVWSILNNEQVAELQRLKPASFPLIFLDKNYSGIEHDAVVYDGFSAGQELMEHLLDDSFDEAYFFVRDRVLHFSSIQERLQGLQQALIQNGYSENTLKIIAYKDANECYENALLFNEKNKIVITASNSEAEHFIKLLKNKQLTYNNYIKHATFIGRNIYSETSIVEYRFSIEEMAKETVELLISRLNGNRSAAKIIKTPGYIEKSKSQIAYA